MSFQMSLVFLSFLCSIDSIVGATNETRSISLVDWDTGHTKYYLLIGIFILSVSLGKLIYHKLDWLASYIPESLLLIIFGIIAGIIFRYSFDNVTHYHLTPTLFFLILLPPIVLDSAYHMYNRTFGDIFGIVIIMAVLGTVFCFLLIAFSLYGLECAGAMGSFRPTNENLMAILLFSSLIVAVDPVAVLAIFKDIGVDRELYYMVFGESLLNDAVTVVLYAIMKSFIGLHDASIRMSHVVLGIVSFFTVSGGGLLIGLVVGILSSLITRFQSKSNMHCITLAVSAYLSYLLADTLKWSGIISLIGCGIVQAAYAFKNISSTTLGTLRKLLDLTAGISEAIIFVYLGVELFINDQFWNAGFQIWAIVMCIVSRFIVLVVLRVFINYARVDQRKISWTELFVATYGGLRGAVAFSLVTLIEDGLIVPDNFAEDERMRNLFTTTTLIIIFFTVGVMGTTMKPLAKLLNVKRAKETTLSLNTELNIAIVDNLMSMVEVITRQTGRNRFRMFLSHFDNLYVRPLLVNDPHDNLSFKILKRYQQITLALHYASTNKDDPDEHLINIPRSLWPKPVLTSSSFTLQASVIRNLRKITLTKISNPEDDPMLDDAKFASLLESAHINRLKDIVHRKTSAINSPLESKSSNVSSSSPKKSNTELRKFSYSNLGYIEDEREDKESKIITTKI